MTPPLDEKIIHRLRSLQAERATAAFILNSLLGELPVDDKFMFMMYFMKAFDLPIAQAKPILGWVGLGGSLSDEGIDEFLNPQIWR